MASRVPRLGWLLLALGVGLMGRLPGQTAALSFSSEGSGAYLDTNNRMLGWEFTVSQQLDVLALGWFDWNDNGLALSHQVGIWDVASPGAPLITAFVPSGTAGMLAGHFRYTTLGSPITLQVGNTYRVAGYDVGNSGDPHTWDVILEGYENKEVIAFDHDARIGLIAGGGFGQDAPGFQYPTTFTGDGRSVLMGPNLLLSTVPEPATTTLLLTLAAGGAVMWMRVRRRAA